MRWKSGEKLSLQQILKSTTKSVSNHAVDNPCYDFVIVGGGLAGLAAGLRAQELGLRSVVIEKGTEPNYLCNTRMSGGVIHAAYKQVMRSEKELCQAIDRATEGFSNPALAQAVAKDGRKLVRWLQGHGVQFLTASGYEYHKWTLAPPPQNRPGLQWPGRGGDVMMRKITARLLALGGEIHLGINAYGLNMQDGQCVGVKATSELKHTDLDYQAKAVLLADGGFQGNSDLMRQFISADPSSIKQRGAGTGTGDGLMMAQRVGAALIYPQAFYGHVLCLDAMHSDHLWPYPMIDTIASSGIVVNDEGNRFVDEGRGGVFIANAIARLKKPLGAFVIFDHLTWMGPATERLIPPNPNLARGGGRIFCQPTMEQLCSVAQLPETVKATVTAYNMGITSGEMPVNQPNRTTKPYSALPIVEGPFYAIPLCAGITYTMGGISIDSDARVLRDDGSVILGLFAAGATTGGLEGGPFAGYVGGLLKAGVMGIRAAQKVKSECLSLSI